jgi:hypothetical protein
MQDAADHAAIIHAILAAYVRRQMRLDPLPLLVVQPKQVASHDLCSPPAENHYPIQPSSVLLSFDPSQGVPGTRGQERRRHHEPSEQRQSADRERTAVDGA